MVALAKRPLFSDNRTVSYRGRFAPSPTGDLHLGSAATAMFAAAFARRARGQLILRVEDLDPPRVVAGAEASQLADLDWLGIRFDEQPGASRSHGTGPFRQSERLPLYQAALDELARRDLVYLCDCSRAEIARAASAPHAGEEGPVYPGTCRAYGLAPRAFRRPPAVRLRTPPGETVVDDGADGFVEDVARAAGDFVLRRGDGVFAYQLAVVVDDVTMGIREVVRGWDLRSSAARQVLLARLLGAPAPRYVHVGLLVNDAGVRLSKRDGGSTVREVREAGRSPAELLRALARAYGFSIAPETEAHEVVAALSEMVDPRRMRVPEVVLGSVTRELL